MQQFWITFWFIALVASGVVFTVITAIVAVKGGAELVAMFKNSIRASRGKK